MKRAFERTSITLVVVAGVLSALSSKGRTESEK